MPCLQNQKESTEVNKFPSNEEISMKEQQQSLETVIERLRAEFEYSKKWDAAREEKNEPASTMDRNKPIESWICWMEEFICKARSEASKSSDKTAALHEIRKVANLAIACLVYRGCPDR